MNTLLTTPVCVAKDDRYDDSMGAYTVFYLWNGEKVTTEGGMYSGLSFDAYSVAASLEQIRSASEWLEANTKHSGNYNKYANAYTYIGCIVKLSRSRKMPNKTELKVLDYADRYYSNQYNCWIDSKVLVLNELTGDQAWVNHSCISELVKGVQDFPFWYISEEKYNQIKINKFNDLHTKALELNNRIDSYNGILKMVEENKHKCTENDIINISNVLKAEYKDISFYIK